MPSTYSQLPDVQRVASSAARLTVPGTLYMKYQSVRRVSLSQPPSFTAFLGSSAATFLGPGIRARLAAGSSDEECCIATPDTPDRVTRPLVRLLRHIAKTPGLWHTVSRPTIPPALPQRVSCRFGVPLRIGTSQGLPAPTRITSWANTWPKVRPRTVISGTAFDLFETQYHHPCKAWHGVVIPASIQILRWAPGNVISPSSEPPSSFVDS